MAFFASLLGPLLGGLFSHSASGSVEGAAAQLQASEQADTVATLTTNTQMSHRSTQMTNLVDVRNEQTQETAMYDQYLIAVQGAQQNIVQKQEQLIDQIAQQA
jgi:hypothetical protein